MLAAGTRWDWWHFVDEQSCNLGGGFKDFLFLPLFGEMIQFDYCNIFQMGWELNHLTSFPFPNEQQQKHAETAAWIW